MGVVLLVVAVIASIANLLAVVSLLVWGLAGGDGEPKSPLHGIVALLVLAAGLYTIYQCFAAFGDIAESQWLVMWLLPMMALVVVLLPEDDRAYSVQERLTALWSPVALAAPPLLVWAAGAVG